MLKKIAVFSTADFVPPTGGAEIAIGEIAKRLPQYDFDLFCARLDRSRAKFEKIGNVRIFRIGIGLPIFDKLLLAFRGHSRTLKQHEREPYGLIWVVMASYGGIPAVKVKEKIGLPYLLTLQEGDPLEAIEKKGRLIRPYFKKMFVLADGLQAISKFLLDWGISMGFRGKVARIVPNGVDLKNFQTELPEATAGELKMRLGYGAGDKVLITTSRLVRKNAVGDVIKALKSLPAEVKFLVLGVGSEEEMLKTLAKDLGVSDRVRFLGLVSHDEMPKYLHLADIFIRPSLSEGLGSSFLEAMAAGLPVIATPVGGIPDFLFDPTANPDKEPTGLFCKVEDPASIAEKVNLLLRDSALRSRIADNGRRLAEEKYDWAAVAGQMNDIFNKLS
jgi:glycosyltransferase involved in cell wall biosynthesis